MVDYPIVYQTTSGLSIGQRIDKPMDFGGAHLFKTSPLGLYPFFTAIKWEKKQIYILQRRRVRVWFTWESLNNGASVSQHVLLGSFLGLGVVRF
jgi:hypothetical protein